MRVMRVNYQNYRNLAAAEATFSDGMNVLWGKNAQGKSNILEGIYYFARGRSFRGASERELVAFGAEFANLGLTFRRDGAEHPVVLEASLAKAGKRKLFRNGAKLTSMVEMMGGFRAVLFCPAQLTLVTGGPSERRLFLDIAIAQLSSGYLMELRRYAKILAQRNALLKTAAQGQSVSKAEWDVYAEQLADAAVEIAAVRAEYTALLSEAVKESFRDMTDGREKPELVYQSHVSLEEYQKHIFFPLDPEPAECGGQDSGHCDDAAQRQAKERAKGALYERLTANLEREIAVGSTLWGIHKDEVRLTLNGREAKLYGSQGQQRSLVFAMKLAEGEIARRVGGEYPCLLLDDVFSELDEDRRRYILGKINGRQIIVTSCEPDIIPKNFPGDVCFRHVEDGAVLEE